MNMTEDVHGTESVESINDAVDQVAEGSQSLLFSQEEVRVLGALMEKQLTVPDTYPLTQNSLVLACNQKSSRDPQMNLTHGEVGQTVKRLVEKGLAVVEYGERADRYRHLFRQYFSLEKPHQALMCVMLLRGPQTLNELKTRTQRMYEFESNVEIKQTLERLTEGDQSLAQCLPKGSGRREDRYGHTLCGKAVIEVAATVPSKQGLEQRIEALEAAVERLQIRLESLEPEQF